MTGRSFCCAGMHHRCYPLKVNRRKLDLLIFYVNFKFNLEVKGFYYNDVAVCLRNDGWKTCSYNFGDVVINLYSCSK